MTTSQRPPTDYVFVDMDDPARYKRIKVQRACNFCRKRKTKCDIGVPQCSNCQKMGINCVFSEPSPKKSGTPEDYEDDMLGGGHDGSLSDASGNANYLDLPKTRRDTRSRSSSVSSNGPFSPTFMEPYQAQEMLKDLGEFIGQLRIGDHGQAEYTSILAEPETQDLLMDSDATYLAVMHQGPTELPSADLEAYLYDVYFREVHPYYPVLNKSTFYNQLKDERTKPSLMLRNAIMAVASTFADDARLAEYMGPENLQGYYFYERARTLFDIHTDTPRLSMLQALLLLVKYQEIAKRRGFFRNLLYFSMCIRFSEFLDLHRQHSKVATDKVSAETGRRVFWIIYTLDRLVSTAQGRRFSIEEKSIDTSLPSLLEGEDADDQLIVAHLVESVKLVQIHSSIVRHVRDVANAGSANSATSAASLTQLENRLAEWHNGLSAPVGIDGEGDNETPFMNTIPNSSHLQLFYEANRILLHRAYLANPVEGNSHIDICTQSALNITRLASNMLNEMSAKVFLRPIRGVYSPVYCLVLASQVHLINISSGDEPTINNAKDRFPKSLAILRELAEYTAIPEMRENVDRLETAFSNKSLLTKMEQLRSTYSSMNSAQRPFTASALSLSESAKQKSRKRSSPPAPKGSAKRSSNARQQGRRPSSGSPLNTQPSSGYHHSAAPEPTSQGVTIPPFQTYQLLFGPDQHTSSDSTREASHSYQVADHGHPHSLSTPSPPLSSRPGYYPYTQQPVSIPMVTDAYQELEYSSIPMLYDHTWTDNTVVTTVPQGFNKSAPNMDARTFTPRILTHEGEVADESEGMNESDEWSSWKGKQG